MSKYTVLVYLLISFSGFCFAAEDIIVIESTITGSKEQPKVISIVPWKPILDPGYIGEEVEGLGQVDNVFQTLEPVTFNRERRYINATRRVKKSLSVNSE